MSLRCQSKGCLSTELATGAQLAFYQDINNGGWNLGLGPEFKFSETALPPNIDLVDSFGDKYSLYTVICKCCSAKLGKVTKINGFEQPTVNFSAKNVYIMQSKFNPASTIPGTKWSKILPFFPNIRKIIATVAETVPLVGSNTVQFHGVRDMQDMIIAGKAVSSRSGLIPRRYQWRSFFFNCVHNVSNLTVCSIIIHLKIFRRCFACQLEWEKRLLPICSWKRIVSWIPKRVRSSSFQRSFW